MPEVLNQPVFLDTLRTNDKYREEFTAIAPDIKADIVSFQTNPNCGCRRKIQQFLEENKSSEPLTKFFDTWKPQVNNLFITVDPNAPATTANPAVTAVAGNQPPQMPTRPITPGMPQMNPPQPGQAPGSQPQMKPMHGHVVEISAEPAEFKKLIEHSIKDRWIYRSFSVMEKKNAEGQDVWLVFFI
jgi:hypothetical protein